MHENLKNIPNVLAYVVIFFSGASVMIIELVGSRVIAPFVGNSVYVWTSLIGIILGSLSAGYYYGGKLADQSPSLKILSYLLFFAGISTTLIVPLAHLSLYLGIIGDKFNLWSIFYSPFLFVPATFFFGMISPYVIRLYISKVETSGSAVGGLYALSTIGSIVGTFLGGFFLISFYGNQKILITLGILNLLLASFVYFYSSWNYKKLLIVLVISIVPLSFFLLPPAIRVEGRLVLDKDTPYKRVWVYDTIDKETNRSIRVMTDTIFGRQSGIFLDNKTESVLKYQSFFDLATELSKNYEDVLMIGAGAYTYPIHLLKKNTVRVDVVEIDQSLIQIAKEYFDVTYNEKMQVFHEDGRTFLNNSKTKYDIVFLDAFNSLLSIPYQLTTFETISKIYETLSSDGIFITNIISAIEGYRGDFLRAEIATYKSIFPKVYVFKVDNSISDFAPQNFVIVALKDGQKKYDLSSNTKLRKLFSHQYIKDIPKDMPILTDDFAPVEKYIAKFMI